jgi:hypothetical protein
MEQTTEVQELSLEKVINSKLVQNNVTDQVLAALKDKYSGLKLKALDDKESYLEIKAAAKECAKVRTLAVKICKEGREDAVKTQKLWIATEKRVVGEVAEVENPLCDEIDRFDAEVQRKVNEEKKRQEEAYINRQAALTKMGARYEGGCFVLGEASFEAELVKGASQDVWEEAVIPKFQVEYEKIEAVRVEEERQRAEREAAFRAEQERLRQEQEAFRQQQEEFSRKKQEAYDAEQVRLALAENAKVAAEQKVLKEMLSKLPGWSYNGFTISCGGNIIFGSKQEFLALSDEEFDNLVAENNAVLQKKEQEAQERRLAEIESAKQEAIKKEQERLAEEARMAEIKRQQEEARKAEELAQASDKVKYANLIKQLGSIAIPEMRSGQYRKKVAVIREKLEEIFSL